MAQITNPDLYKFKVFPAAALPEHATTIDDIQNGTLDGIVIEGVLSPEEAQQITTRFKQMVANAPFNQLYYPAPFGHVFGATLMESNLDNYFKNATLARQGFEHLFRHRFESLVIGILSKLTTHFSVHPTVHQHQQVFAPASMRILEPGFDSLEAHIHQEFPMHFPSYQAASAQLDLTTELSYYIVLQAPEAGGELVLYNLQWQNTPNEMLQTDVFLTGIRSEDLEKHDQMLLNLAEGDMILFAANRIWHKVAAVHGNQRERITIGGFLAKARDKNEYRLFI
jgi:hypothetical protein